jgi:alpha-L-fucosidase
MNTLFKSSLVAALLILPVPARSQQSADPAAPTKGRKSAAEIDREWQVSVSKYDDARNAILSQVDQQANDGPYRPDWETLHHWQVPQWYKDAKFGIFIHWGVYAVPGSQNEWYPRNMYRPTEAAYQDHLKKYGPPDKFGYKDFIPLFKAEKFDANDWAQLFKAAGARYVVPVAEHHDGFSMYDSGLSDWTVVKMGPRRDTTGELAKAVRAAGLHFGVSSHRVEHNFFFDGGRAIRSDVNDPQFAALYGPAHTWLEAGDTGLQNDWTYVSPQYANDWLARSAELVEKYKPEIVYFDWWIGQPNLRHNVTEFAAFYYNFAARNGFPALIDMKDYAIDRHASVKDFERGMRDSIESQYWQTDTSISNVSWGYVEHDQLKSADFIVHQLIDIVSKNGNLLLNIGPRPDGTIPGEVRATLLGIGAWLQQNGEAIYGTTPWQIYGEGPTKIQTGFGHDVDVKPYVAEDVRFTQKGTTLYAILMAWPSGGHAQIHALGSSSQAQGLHISNVELLGSNSKIEWKQTDSSLDLQLPAAAPGKYAYAFRITVASGAN